MSTALINNLNNNSLAARLRLQAFLLIALSNIYKINSRSLWAASLQRVCYFSSHKSNESNFQPPFVLSLHLFVMTKKKKKGKALGFLPTMKKPPPTTTTTGKATASGDGQPSPTDRPTTSNDAGQLGPPGIPPDLTDHKQQRY